MNAINIFRPLQDLQAFLELGGPVLEVILFTTFLMWALIVERLAYFVFSQKHEAIKTCRIWQDRKDHTSWYAQKIRTQLISQNRQNAERNIALILTLVAISPLLGLLGTVTGMISVFDVMATTGSSDIRSMSAGVSRATITTMAGMVAAISGLIIARRLERHSRLVITRLANMLEPGWSDMQGKRGRKKQDEAQVDMTPMLDIVFIMLIFFIATAVFVQERTISLIPQPRDEEAKAHNPDPLILIQVTDRNLIYINQQITDIKRVGAKISSLRAEHSHSGVLISPDDDASHGIIVNIVEQVEGAGGAWSIQREGNQ